MIKVIILKFLEKLDYCKMSEQTGIIAVLANFFFFFFGMTRMLFFGNLLKSLVYEK